MKPLAKSTSGVVAYPVGTELEPVPSIAGLIEPDQPRNDLRLVGVGNRTRLFEKGMAFAR